MRWRSRTEDKFNFEGDLKMASNVLFFGWNRSLPGREKLSAEHFGDITQYLGALQQKGSIKSFDAVFLNPHGGDLNGFLLIRAESAQLDALVSSVEWVRHMTRAVLHLDHAGEIRGVTGELVKERMNLWTSLIPS
jgi:hypothetical protein